jgi:hypothetical protein
VNNNIVIIRGRDRHTVRLKWGLSAIGINPIIVDSLDEIPDRHVDITLVDPSVSFDPSSKINSKVTAFFDTEDDPCQFDPDVAYAALSGNVEYYVKMNWVDDDRCDKIRNIGFPIHILLECGHFARQEKLPWNKKQIAPVMVAAPTYMGGYKPVRGGLYCSDEFVSCFTVLIDNETGVEEIVYNQRYDWLLSLKQAGIPYVGGINFSEDVYSLEHQTNWHGDVAQFTSPTGFISKSDQYKLFQNFPLALVPTGHERISWRVFDAMAAGAIIYWTDNCGQQTMYNPVSYITVKDGENLPTKIGENFDFEGLWEESEKNREVLSKLTPEVIRRDFFHQFN